MLTKEMIKKVAMEAGADAVGFGDLNRFDGAPPDMDPRYIYPKAKSIIGFLFRMPRGVQRGVEEGTQFYQYPSLAYGGINEVFAPTVLYQVGKLIEDHGYEAVVYRNTGARGKVSDMTGEEGPTLSPEEQIAFDDNEKDDLEIDITRTASKTPHHRSVEYTRPVSADKRAPDLQFHFRIAGVVCGLGEIGWSKMFLSPEFGPMVRFAFLFTDAPLEPDPMYNGEPLCIKCMACARECPGQCLSTDRSKSNKIYIGGKLIEWAEYDAWKCYAFYTYPGRKFDPFVPTEVFEEHKDDKLALLEGKEGVKASEKEVIKVYSVLENYFPTWMGYNMAKCGGCIGACVNMLEKSGCLKGKFKEPFRRERKHWVLNR
jgi:ferredoxin